MVSCRRRLLLVAWVIAGLLVMLALGLAGAGPAGARAPLAQCEDGVDNDGDGKVDAPFDPGCANAGNNSEIDPPTAPQCSNGGSDFPFHPQCAAAGDNKEDEGATTQCSNTVDDDAPADGLTDYPADRKCLWAADPNEVERLCSNGKDDDNDGFRDFPEDIGCANHNDNNETNLPQCDDGRDNDGDGTVDFDPGHDSDCDSPTDTVEAPPLQPPHCSDNADNDGDGKADFPNDPGCTFAGDNDETDPPPPPPALCADGLDNDGDGRIDFPADPGCGSESDEDETDTVVYILPQGQLTPPPPTVATTRLLTPFPIVRLRGRADRKGVRVTLLTVRAPEKSTVSIYCSGVSCPRRRVAVDGGRKLVRVKQFERRLRGGTVLRVYVTRPGFVGKYTRFRFKNKRVPLRTDRCATTPGTGPLSCPAS